MTDWAAFAGITGFVLAVLLSLAHLSRGIPHGDGADSTSFDDSDARATAPDEPAPSPSEGDERSRVTADIQTDASLQAAADAHATTDAVNRAETADTAETTETTETAGTTETAEIPDTERTGDTAETPVAAETATATDAHDLASPSEPPVSGSAISEFASTPTDYPPHLLLANVAISQALLGGFLGLGAWYAEIPPGALGLSLADVPTKIGLGVALGVTLYVVNRVGSSVSKQFGLVPDEELRESLTPRSLVGWVLLFAVALPLIAGFEEFLFRGALIGAVAAGFDVSPWLMASLSSVTFGLGHGAQGRLGIIVTGLLGFVLAAAFVLTGSLLVVIVAHYLVNALEFVGHEVFDW